MVITNEVNLFGIERVTEEEFRRWSRFFLEEVQARTMPRGFTSPALESGHVLVPEDVNNFYVQAFLSHYRGYFEELERLTIERIPITMSDTLRIQDFFPTIPDKMEFDDYLHFMSVFLEQDMYFDRVHDSDLKEMDRRSILYGLAKFKQHGWDVISRDTYKISSGGIGYFSANPNSKTSKVHYFDTGSSLGLDKHNLKIPELFEGENNPYLRYPSISFIGKFGTVLVPFVNVTEFFYLNKREFGLEIEQRGPVEGTYSGFKYSKSGKEPILTSPRQFTI